MVPSKYLMTMMIIVMMISFYYFARLVSPSIFVIVPSISIASLYLYSDSVVLTDHPRGCIHTFI